MSTIAEALTTAVELHRRGRLQEAESVYRQILASNPDHADALHLLGRIAHQCGRNDLAVEYLERAVGINPTESCFQNTLGEAYRALGRLSEAAGCYERALQLDPELAEAHNNRGLVWILQSRLEEASACFQRAAHLKPDLAEAHSNLGNVWNDLGQLDDAASCYAEALRLRPTYSDALYGLGVVHDKAGRFELAVEHLERAVRIHPADSRFLYALGSTYRKLRRLNEAAECYQRALQLNPEFAEAQHDLGVVRTLQRRLEEASACLERAVQLKPDLAKARCNLGNVWNYLGQLDKAASCYKAALRIQPAFADALSGLGLLHQQVGDFEQAERCWRDALRHDPSHVDSQAELASMLRGSLPDDDLAHMRQLVTEPHLSQTQRSNLHFGLAHVLDARGEFGPAAEHLSFANALALADARQCGLSYDPQDHDRSMDMMMQAFSAAHFARVQGWGSHSDRPVFIFGMPRTGTTLTEQILAGHSQVFAAGELPLASKTWESLPVVVGGCQTAFAAAARLDRQSIANLSGTYLDQLRLLDDSAPRITDKMPMNYTLLGLLATLFPQAKFIHCRRELRDAALSCWTTRFLNLRWSNDQEHIASRIRTYLRLMEHWYRVLPVAMLEVHYEDTVTNLEQAARRLVEWCGLPWEPACLAFHERRRAVRTASTIQVRKPIYNHAMGRWKNYEETLASLFSRLPGF